MLEPMINQYKILRPKRRTKMQLSQIVNSRQFKFCIGTLRDVFLLVIFLSFLLTYRRHRIHQNQIVKLTSKAALKYVMYKDKQLPPLRTKDIKRAIEEYNSRETILNEDVFGGVKSDTVVIVINVGKPTIYLKYLIASLSEVRGIQNALLIFSHSRYDKNFNEFVRMIDFCRVLQIFFPYSVEANKNTFPDFQKGDCRHDTGLKLAKIYNCTGSYTPDINGRFRQPLQAEKKHHWWWTANKVFENLTFSETHDGIVVFLDDDVFVLEDFMFMLLYMRDTTESLSQNMFLSLGNTNDDQIEEGSMHRVAISSWDTNHSGALAFDFEMWNKIVSQYDFFCNIDDYSWLRSLLHVSLYLPEEQKFKVISSEVPRAYKIGKRGFFEKLMRSRTLESVHRVLTLQERIRDKMYPPHLEFFADVELPSQDYNVHFHSNYKGGWSDPRDRKLCWDMTIRKIKKIIFDMDLQYSDFHRD